MVSVRAFSIPARDVWVSDPKGSGPHPPIARVFRDLAERTRGAPVYFTINRSAGRDVGNLYLEGDARRHAK
jgi:hypothetical protein